MFFNKKEEFEETETKIIADIRALNIDIINKHGCSNLEYSLNIIPALYTLYSRHIKIDKNDANWINRDRVVLSTYTGISALVSVLATCSNYISLDTLKEDKVSFKDLPGVDLLTNKFAEGVSIAAGMTLGEKYLNSLNKDIFDFNTYLLCTDLDLINGTSYETFSYIGKNKLNKIITIYDCNPHAVGDDNKLELNAVKYFESLNFNIVITNKENIIEIDSAINKAKESDKPTVIILNHENRQYEYEGNYYITDYKLSEEEITKLKNNLNVRDIPFTVTGESVERFQSIIDYRMKNGLVEWYKVYDELKDKDKKELDKIKNKTYNINSNIDFDIVEEETLNETSNKIIKSLESQNSLLFKDINEYPYRNNMLSVQNGLALVGLRNYTINALSNVNNVIQSIMTASIMKLPNIYIFIEDEENSDKILNLRNIPNIKVFRPNDANELIGIYKLISNEEVPCCIILGNKITTIKEDTSIVDVTKGGYIVKKEEKNISCILISNGNDLDIALDIYPTLKTKGYDLRIVSMSSLEQFQLQDKKYQDEILPFGTKVFVIENSNSYSWYKFVYNDKYLITSDKVNWDTTSNYEEFKETIIEKIENLLK